MTNAESLKELWQLSFCIEHEGFFYGIWPLFLHVAVIGEINESGYGERYCYHNEVIALKAIKHFAKTGEWKWYKKNHTKNISINGKHAYKNGALQIPENALYEVDWDTKELEVKYPHLPLSM